LTSSWFILQRARGHRHSIDDVLTAHFALQAVPDASTHLDLGAGIGTVGLLVLSAMPAHTVLTFVEAQAISYRLLLANVSANQLSERVHAVHGDLRQFVASERFQLITASPPYFPPSAGIVPRDSQKAHARFELRGDLFDYARTAARQLAADGHFVVCFPTPQKRRTIEALDAAGLTLLRSRAVIPRAGLPALFSLFASGHRKDAVLATEEEPLVVRGADGALLPAMQLIRQGFGFAD
jgi:tRNA1Val (adenine37-N6)-methyltransferase